MQNVDSQVIMWGAIALLVMIAIVVTSNKLRRGLAFFARAAFGIAAIAAINFTLGSFGLFIGINALTIAVVAFLGIPGIIMLYGLGFFI